MQAGQLAQLDAPASDRLEDTTEQNHSLPALAVNATQTDLEGGGAVQDCTAAARVTTEQEQAIVYDGGITTDRVEGQTEMVADVVADVTGTGLVVAERTGGNGRYPFPYDMIVAQTGRDITQYNVTIPDFVAHFDESDLHDTTMVGVDDGEGVSLDYNDRAKPEDAPDATVGIGFTLSWNGTVGSGVLYESGYLAIYSGWTASTFVAFVEDTILPYTYADDSGGEQTTLGGA